MLDLAVRTLCTQHLVPTHIPILNLSVCVCCQVRDYMGALEGHLVGAHKQAARLVRKGSDLSTALAEFGLAAEQLVGAGERG